MIASWLLRNPLVGGAAVLSVALLIALGVQTIRLRSCQATNAHQVEVIAAMRAGIELQNAAVDHVKAAAEAARKRSLAALEAARVASAARTPAIASLTAAERAGGALTCGDAVERIRDALL